MKKRKIMILAISIFILVCNICYSDSIQEEIARVEKEANKYKIILENTEPQQHRNIISSELYFLWDNELNSLWKKIFKELNPIEKKKLLIQQRKWIKRKEENVEMAGQPFEGGSIQPFIHNTRAIEMTRARVYTLAKYLAHIKKESFYISNEVKETLDYADPSLNDIFKLFEGCWEIFDETGKYISIERSEMCFYGIERSNWTIWVSNGVVLSDLDVYSYTKDTIIFKVLKNSENIFYKLTVNSDYSMVLVSGNSLDRFDWDNAIFSYDFKENSQELRKFIKN